MEEIRMLGRGGKGSRGLYLPSCYNEGFALLPLPLHIYKRPRGETWRRESAEVCSAGFDPRPPLSFSRHSQVRVLKGGMAVDESGNRIVGWNAVGRMLTRTHQECLLLKNASFQFDRRDKLASSCS